MITITFEKNELLPGDAVTGWVKAENPISDLSGEVRLFYFTAGKGTQDVQSVACQPLKTGSREQQFSFTLPTLPWSVSGQLLTVSWAIEVVLKDEYQRATFTMSPTGKEIILGEPTQKSNVLPFIKKYGLNARR